jgi:hypothetical protein
MPVLNQWELTLNVSDVLRAQGADPDVIQIRRPALIDTTQQAINRGIQLLDPVVLFERYPVKRLLHDRLELEQNSHTSRKAFLSGELIAQHLGRAEDVIVMICSIGVSLEETVSSLFKVDPVSALALDGVGSAAVEKLAILACNYFEDQVHSFGLNTSVPLNPGMIGWPVEEGQPEIFVLLDSEEIQVSLNDSYMMTPNKSLSMVLGVGKNVSPIGISCDYCSLKGVCKYQNHYAR